MDKIKCQLSVGNVPLDSLQYFNKLPVDKFHYPKFKNTSMTVVVQPLLPQIAERCYLLYGYVPTVVYVFVKNSLLASTVNEIGYYSFITSDLPYTLRKLARLVGSKKKLNIIKMNSKRKYMVTYKTPEAKSNGEVFDDLVLADEYYMSAVKAGASVQLKVTNPFETLV